MFWKKKKDSGRPLLKNVGDNQRESFRYAFQPHTSPRLVFLDKPVQVINLSAGGLAFANEEFNVGDQDQISMVVEVPSRNFSAVFRADLKILLITPDDVCHGYFENCSDTDFETLHKYVLELQKKDLQQPSL